MAKVDAVLFDFGGVFTLSPFTAFDEVGRSLGARPGQIQEIVFGNYHEDGDHPWHRLERGEMTLDDCRTEIMTRAEQDHGLKLDIYEVFAAMPRDGGLRTAFVDKVAELKTRGLRRAIITNNVKEFADGWRSLMPVDELFELVVDSCVEGIRKPNPKIFELTLQRMGIDDPSRTVFLDDYPANIAAAQKLGMKTVLVTEEADVALLELDGLLSS
ncbi:MAG: hypothetical protein CMN84_07440 [Spongiibacteraceae bacterium]|jgi:putative hydrolase of the HAD superfamily|nr:hypothetical protein [Spongiibacteraceae bacterium]